ncbi:efflux RND transporter periplasmic adaptor subunit [Spongiibacter taiwanensis]|uniref:efflux RND transporter periplasmic adaptor subunit n=1 Tax=Spongiibacter taiwanensis TaxID=1748242 RepID=UPI00203606C6|nr:efflux RND transporter periplasmic adaptor subunit [Spongiibacter taiwanensis]USA42336.1 efflux RND transporter periplasmic adaptor subunit [Spongiibacter taiwanensis]
MTLTVWQRGLIATALLVSTASATAGDPVPVTAVQPEKAQLGETLRLSGSVTALRRAALSARVDGLVKDILVEPGAAVTQGQALLRQDAALAQLDHQQALAARDEAAAAQREASRLLREAERLRADNHISENEVNIRRASLAQADAALAAGQARANLTKEVVARHDLLAPFDGVISQRLVDSGEWLSRGSPAFELVSLDPVLVDVSVPQERYADIRPDTAVRLCPDTRPGQCLPGKVAAIIPLGDSSARAFRVRLAATGDNDGLLPGSSAAVEFTLGDTGTPQLVISRDALLRHPDGRYSVFVANNGTASRRNVTLGRESAGKVIVRTGLAEGDRVIVRGNELLSEGQAISITNGAD